MYVKDDSGARFVAESVVSGLLESDVNSQIQIFAFGSVDFFNFAHNAAVGVDFVFQGTFGAAQAFVIRFFKSGFADFETGNLQQGSI